MPINLVASLIKDFKALKTALDTHLTEGVGIKVAIAEIKRDNAWIKGLVLFLLTLVVGLYFKR